MKVRSNTAHIRSEDMHRTDHEEAVEVRALDAQGLLEWP